MTPVLFMIRLEQREDGWWTATWDPHRVDATAERMGEALIELAHAMDSLLPEPTPTPVSNVGVSLHPHRGGIGWQPGKGKPCSGS